MMDSTIADFTVIDHTADLGIRGSGSDPKDLFEKAAQAMMKIMVRGGSSMESRPLELTVTGEDYADLLVRWLGEILYLFQGEGRVMTGTEVGSITPTRLYATVWTVPLDHDRHEVLTEIKAVTYHGIQVAQKGGRWHAEVIFDL